MLENKALIYSFKDPPVIFCGWNLVSRIPLSSAIATVPCPIPLGLGRAVQAALEKASQVSLHYLARCSRCVISAHYPFKLCWSVSAKRVRQLPSPHAPRKIRRPHRRRARWNPSGSAHVWRSLHPHSSWSVFLCARHPQDLHVRVLLHWRAVRHLRFWNPPHEPAEKTARQQAILLRNWWRWIKPEEVPHKRECGCRFDGIERGGVCLSTRAYAEIGGVTQHEFVAGHLEWKPIQIEQLHHCQAHRRNSYWQGQVLERSLEALVKYPSWRVSRILRYHQIIRGWLRLL